MTQDTARSALSSVEQQPPEAASGERVLGVRFFHGTAEQAAERIGRAGGLLVAPAAPALLNLKFEEGYRDALQRADLALADSALLAKLWKLRSGRVLPKVSGLAYLQALLATGTLFEPGAVLFVVRSDEEKRKALSAAQAAGASLREDAFYVPKTTNSDGDDHALLLQLEERRPRHVVIALRSGVQEKLGLYLRDYLLYRPAIHCVGAALGFLSGAEGAIPPWADRYQLGWVARLVAQPRMILPRLGIAVALAAMVFKYGSELPRLRPRWTDL